MDIVRQRSFFQRYKRQIYSASALIGLIAVFSLIHSVLQPATLQVKKDTLLMDTVQRGDLSITVLGHGKLVPRKVVWISSQAAGKVEEILVKPGSVLASGDVLARLSNLELERETEEERWNLMAQRADRVALIENLETRLLTQDSAVSRAKYSYQSLALKHKAQEQLIKEGRGAISLIEFRQIELNVKQAKEIWDIEQEILQKLKADNIAAKNASEARLSQLEENLQFKESSLESLAIRAPSDGVVQEVVQEVGQRVDAGASLFKLVNPQDVLATIQIPEVQARLIQLKQKVIMNLRSQIVEGVVSRIDPAVVNGSVNVDVEFVTEGVDGIRPDLSVEGEIIIEQLNDVEYVKRTAFSRENQFSTVYVKDPNNNTAYQREVKFGRSSVDKIEVLSGLNQGEVVLLNNPTPWLSYPQILIK